jgi:large subunit ribosomal protein L24
MYGKPKQKNEQTTRTLPHVRKNDTVVVLSGKDRGKQGKVLRVDPNKGKAIVERVNFTRKIPQKNQLGGILVRESPIEVSKLQVVCPSCNQPTRTGSHRTAEGATRFCRKCDAEMGK